MVVYLNRTIEQLYLILYVAPSSSLVLTRAARSLAVVFDPFQKQHHHRSVLAGCLFNSELGTRRAGSVAPSIKRNRKSGKATCKSPLARNPRSALLSTLICIARAAFNPEAPASHLRSAPPSVCPAGSVVVPSLRLARGGLFVVRLEEGQWAMGLALSGVPFTGRDRAPAEHQPTLLCTSPDAAAPAHWMSPLRRGSSRSSASVLIAMSDMSACATAFKSLSRWPSQRRPSSTMAMTIVSTNDAAPMKVKK